MFTLLCSVCTTVILYFVDSSIDLKNYLTWLWSLYLYASVSCFQSPKTCTQVTSVSSVKSLLKQLVNKKPWYLHTVLCGVIFSSLCSLFTIFSPFCPFLFSFTFMITFSNTSKKSATQTKFLLKVNMLLQYWIYFNVLTGVAFFQRVWFSFWKQNVQPRFMEAFWCFHRLVSVLKKEKLATRVAEERPETNWDETRSCVFEKHV